MNLKHRVLVPWLFLEWKDAYPPAAEACGGFAAFHVNKIKCQLLACIHVRLREEKAEGYLQAVWDLIH